ncbi:hypothetical protein M758_11G162800 [Ceratodon purpureus]|nr:hypothetical protein M758_11G162800 [Ceratodon purpureus]
MSLLKLLFDLPEAGGESNFTVEEQEELMAFEHNLDEHLVENFALPASDDQFGLLDGGVEGEDGGSNDPVDLPIRNGAYSGLDVEMANGVEVQEGTLGLVNVVNPLQNGRMFCSSTIEHFMQPLITEEPAPLEKNAAAYKALEFAVAVSIPERTPEMTNLVSAVVTLPAISSDTAPLEPAVGSVREIAPAKKYDISSKHQGTGKAVWIKWRGKWQAAIQVRVEDCRAATVKAMPTYGKKEYVPIYVVTIRSYIWIDAKNICDIIRKPEPLLSGTHDEWRHLVVDTGAPRRRTFLSLGWEMLDISDRLHIMGVVERARFVSVWKEFAEEASAAAKYSELGSLLVRIHAVVEPDYVRQSWVEKRLKAWEEECLRAETAATIEKLIKECIRVILWDKAAKLWEAPEQPVLDPGWADWKGPAFDELMDPDDAVVIPADKPSRPTSSSSLTPKAEKEVNTGAKRGRPRKSKEGSDRQQPVASTGRVTTRKQVKVEKHYDAGPSSSSAMERFPAASEPVALCSQTLAFSVDATKSRFAVDHTLETKVVAAELQLTGQGSGVKLSQDGPLNPASKTWKWKFKSDAWGCSAFLKNKKRRCPRQAWKGIYCEKHQSLAETPSADPNVEPSHLCMARYWVENRRCANSVVEGSYYCLMHADCRPPKSVDSGVLNDTKDDLKEDNDKVIKQLRCTGVTVQDTQLSYTVKDGQTYSTKLAEQDPGQGRRNDLGAPVNGDGSVVNVDQLSGRPTEKLLKSAASNGNGGFKTNGSLGNPIGDKNLGRLIADMGLKERRNFFKARDLLCKYMNEGLSKGKGGPEEVQCTKMIDFIIDETTNDFSSGEMLLKILTAEKERLGKLVLEDGLSSRRSSDIAWRRGVALPGSQSGNTLKPEAETLSNETNAWQSTSPVQNEGEEAGPDTRYLCCMCGHKFEQLSVLGKHWKEQHKWEAQLFEKCLLCRICEKGGPMFRSKLSVVRHWKAAHPTLPMSSPGWSVCVMCDKQCLDFDHLWQHVEDLHHSQWSSTDFAGRVKACLLSRKGHKCSFCSETFSTYWEVQQHKENVHKDQELLHAGTKRNWDAMDSEVTRNDSKRIDVTLADDTFKYSCRYCSMRFQLLPDLGRHHQAEHKEQPDGRARDQSPSGGMPSMQRRKTNQEEMGSDWHAVPIGRGEGTDKDGNAMKWRYRARSKTKSSTRGRSVPMKKQSGGAEVILQRMRAVKQVLEDQKTKRPPRKRDRKAERARRLAKLAGNSSTPAPIATKFKCRFCGLEFTLLLDLGRHHQAEHSAVKQAFIINGRDEVQTGIYTLTKDGIIGPLQGELLNRPPNSKELLEVARSTCCKEWFFNELGKRYAELPPRLFVQAAHLCSEAKLEIRWHQDKYLCPDGCKSYGASNTSPSLEMDLAEFAKSSSNIFSGDGKDHAIGALDLLSSSNNAVYKSVLSEDLSNGLEKVPVRCVMDGDVIEPCTCSLCMESGSLTSPGGGQPWNDFVYITKRHLDPSLGLDTKSSQVGCSCTGAKCSASSCDHVSMFDTDNAEACTINGNSIRGEFAYDEFGRIILDVGYMVYECNSSCQCKDTCQNRVLQKGVHLKLEVFKSRHKGWGVRAAEAISRGTFVCEYVGEILNDSEANERGKRYDQVGCSYLYDIDAHLDVIGSRSGSRPFVIDATRYGNVARFINHSCEPNLMNYEVLVESMDCQLAHIGFFAKRDIAIGEELAYDYRYKLLPGKGCPCHCGAPKCRGRLY